MTGGVIVVLGQRWEEPGGGDVGRYALPLRPARSRCTTTCQRGVYEIDPLEYEDDERLVDLLERFVEETGSKKAAFLLEHWRSERMNFVRIETSEYQRIRDELRNG